MARIRLLSPADRTAFRTPPLLCASDKVTYFELTHTLKKMISTIRSPYRQVGFILQYGYFRHGGRFFSPTLFHKSDIIFVSQLLNFKPRSINFDKYKEHRLLHDQQTILTMLGFQSFAENKNAQSLLTSEVAHLVDKHIRPKMILYYITQLFLQRKIEMPPYTLLADVILEAMGASETRLTTTLKNTLSKSQMSELDKLLPKINVKKSLQSESYYARAPLVTLREFPLSSRPGKIKESIDGFLIIKALFEKNALILQSLALSKASFKYYAVWVQKAKITQLLQITDPYKRYLYLLAFIAHHYYYRHDLLVDTFLQTMQSVLNRIEKKQQVDDKSTKKEKDRATNMLSLSYREKSKLLADINMLINDASLSAEKKVARIKLWLSQEESIDPNIAACIEKLDKQLTDTLNDTDFYNALEKQSLVLQSRLSAIVKNLNFSAPNSTSPLLEAIIHFQVTQGQIGHHPPQKFLSPRDLKHIVDDKGKLRLSLYKALLFMNIADALKSGEINLVYSYRYLSIDEYLINKTDWQQNRQDYLERAQLTDYYSLSKTIVPLQKKLDEQYHHINVSIEHGKNPHLSFNKHGEIIVDTPKVEKIETQRIAEILKPFHYVPILEVLTTIDRMTHFSECLQHYSIRQQIKPPDPIVFYAGLIGKGCNIGLGKLTSVSKGINGNTLETVVNWYFSNEHLTAANNRIIRFINKLTLPNLMKRTLGKLHTSSDGQKRNVDLDSILANFSFKYHGSGRGVSIYDFIDERHVLFHSLVMSSSEREAAYVIDGLMCNDEIKSDIHSTDTHGYSDLIFGITHLLSISFAPRLAKLKKRTLYTLETRKFYQKKGYRILPDYTINTRLIEENWDDILRLVATIKLKETTASQILKRLSSYAKDNPLYQGLKEFGKLIKTMFLLTYIDDVELRQAIQKQLNKIELANKFSSAVFFDNNQEFKQGSRDDQELAMNCKILMQNAIVLWNYLTLSQLLANTTDPSKHDELLSIIRNGSIMTWFHINLLGEYDFRQQQPASNDSFFDIEKILAWSAT